MKKILDKKNILLVSLIAVFVVFIAYAFVQAAQDVGGEVSQGSNPPVIPTDNQDLLDRIKAPIHVGGGQQAIEGALTLTGLSNGSVFDATSPVNTSAVFEKPSAFVGGSSSSDHGVSSESSFFATVGNSWVGGMLFVGVPRYSTAQTEEEKKTAFLYSENLHGEHNWVKTFNYGSLSASLQKVNIQGSVLATNLIHTGESHDICISPEGTLVMCSAPVGYFWETGDWSECSGDVTGTCNGSWTTTEPGTCVGTYQSDGYCTGDLGVIDPYDGRCDVNGDCSGFDQATCNQYSNWGCASGCSWNLNTYNCSSLGATNEAACEASPHQSCTWYNGASATHYCSDKDGTSQNTCESYNDACTWSENLGTTTRTRTVVCKDSSGQTVADSLCTGEKPATEEECNSSYVCTGTISAGCRSDNPNGLLTGGDTRSGTCYGDYYFLVINPTYGDWCDVDHDICSENNGGDINDCKIQTDQFCDTPSMGTCDWDGDPLDCTVQYSEQSCQTLVNYSDLNGSPMERPCTWDDTLTTPCSAINPQTEQDCVGQNQQASGSNCQWVLQ